MKKNQTCSKLEIRFGFLDKRFKLVPNWPKWLENWSEIGQMKKSKFFQIGRNNWKNGQKLFSDS